MTITICYQEHADQATSCGGLDTGGYFCEGDWNPGFPCENGFDGEWDTLAHPFGNDNAIIYINYSVPDGAYNNSRWKLKQFGCQ